MSKSAGMMLNSQRPQVVNKSILSPCETLICHRLVYKLERKAVDEWIFARETGGRCAVFRQSFPSLPHGRAWLWSPSWLDVFEQVETRRRDTYDAFGNPQLRNAVEISMQPKVYLETTVPSYLAARPSYDVRLLSHQQITQVWWKTRRSAFDLFISELVFGGMWCRRSGHGSETARPSDWDADSFSQ